MPYSPVQIPIYEDLINLKNNDYYGMLSEISTLLTTAHSAVAQSVNTILLDTYWQIGKHIVEFEQKGNDKAEYGSNLLNNISKDLTSKFGSGFSRSNIHYMRQFYLRFPKSETVSHKLSWSHYFEILKVDDPLEMSFYVNQCEKDGWSVRELKRQMKSMLFHRIALSKDKTEVLELVNKGIDVQKPEDIIKDPYGSEKPPSLVLNAGRAFIFHRITQGTCLGSRK